MRKGAAIFGREFGIYLKAKRALPIEDLVILLLVFYPREKQAGAYTKIWS